MKYVGAHVSTAGGVQNAPINAIKIGAKAFALFLKNQKRWVAKPYDEKTIKEFKENLKKAGIKPEYVLPHDGYLINIGNPEKEKREKSLNALLDEAIRVEQLGLHLLNFHPGSHLNKITEKECINYIAEGINYILSRTHSVIMVLETTAGQGTNIGYRFEQLKEIIDKVDDKNRVGVCIDTCHIFAAGYDLRDEKVYEKTMKEFDDIIGFKYLKGVHINDAKVELGSKKDRHHSIGKGVMGIEPFKFIMNDKRFDNIPIILETIEPAIWPEEIKLLYSLIKK